MLFLGFISGKKTIFPGKWTKNLKKSRFTDKYPVKDSVQSSTRPARCGDPGPPSFEGVGGGIGELSGR